MSQQTPTLIRKNKRPFKQRKIQHNQQIHQQQQQQQQEYYDDLSDLSDLSDNSDSDIPLDYIDDMLEESLNERLIKNPKPSHEERKKIVLKKREQDYFEMLPEGWIEVTHFSGMPVYLHKLSRVCTLAKPYYLGSGSTRKHEIPISAIPCLAYQKELDKEKQQECNKIDLINLSKKKEENESSLSVHQSQQREEIENKEEEVINDKLTISKISNDEAMNIVNNDQLIKRVLEEEEVEKEICIDNQNLIINNSTTPIASQEIKNQLNEILITTENLINSQEQSSNNEKAKTKDNQQLNNNSNKRPSFIAKVETVKDNKKERSLNYMKVRGYCEKLFEFQEITIRKFKTWADRRNHMQQIKLAQRPSLPEGTKLITCPMPVSKEQGPEMQGRNMRKEFVMNPAGKSSVCILHEFVQHAEKVQPKYVFQELENANTPYSATVIINNMHYGTGFGSSKKQAKSEAAKATLEILIPDMKEMTQNTNKKQDLSANDLSFFDDIKIEDPRVSELCAKAGQHSPYQILVECLKRNNGVYNTNITTNVRLVKHQKNEFTMKVNELPKKDGEIGKTHTATVICRNKREGKQQAAQAILQLMYPTIQNWGSLLRLFGRGSYKTPKEKKEEEQKITELQNTACANRPNYAILNKLREEMLKLKENDVSFKTYCYFLFVCF